MRWAIVMALCALIPSRVQAQDFTHLPRNEASISIGWSGAAYPATEEYDRWGGSFFAGAGAAHYWTDHLKTEADIGWFSAVKKESYEQIALPDGLAYVRTAYSFREVRASFVQTYQFGRNAWVHPYLGAGADVSVLRIGERRPLQSVSLIASRNGPQTRTVPAVDEQDTDTRVRPIVKGGLKMYVSDKGFVTTELKFGIHSGVEQVLWRTALGFDF